MEQSKQLKNLLKKTTPHPLLGYNYSKKDFTKISLNAYPELDLLTNEGLYHCIHLQLKAKSARFGYGGYLEDRIIYRRSSHFQTEGAARSIHLGIDIWGKAGTPIHAPLDGKIHSWAYNDAPSDYGATIILRHELQGFAFHSLYGHLSREDLKDLKEDQNIPTGQAFCQIGKEKDNGGWVPHLHFQLIVDMQGMKGDYPGVAAPSELDFYKNNCPDPRQLFYMG